MKLATLSATALQRWDNCTAGWAAWYDNGYDFSTADQGGSPAWLGTACHSTADEMVNGGYMSPSYPIEDRAEVMLKFWHSNYYDYFDTDERYEEGLEMCTTWLERSHDLFEDNEFVSAEEKMVYEVQTSKGPVSLRAYFDLCYRKPDGSIVVTDYKTWRKPIGFDEAHRKIQAEIYAGLAHHFYPDAPRVWVIFDQWRYEAIGTMFTIAECKAILDKIHSLAEEIINTKEVEETLNDECKYCIRKSKCDTLNAHVVAGGPLGYTDIAYAAEQSLQLKFKIDGLNSLKREYDDTVVESHIKSEELKADHGLVNTKLQIRENRKLDPVMVARVLGDELAAFAGKYGGIGVTAMDKAKKDPNPVISFELLDQLEAEMIVTYGNPYVTIKENIS